MSTHGGRPTPQARRFPLAMAPRLDSVPSGHRGPLIDRCQPARCGNSIIATEHLPIWQAEHASLTRLRSPHTLPANRRALIDQQIRDVEIALTKAVKHWDNYVSQSTASKRDQVQAAEIARLRRQLRDNRHQRQRLRDEVDAAATVIAALIAENAALRDQLAENDHGWLAQRELEFAERSSITGGAWLRSASCRWSS